MRVMHNYVRPDLHIMFQPWNQKLPEQQEGGSVSYFAVCTFDLESATDEDYENAYMDLKKLGFSREIRGDNGSTFRLPTTTTAGTIEGSSAGALRDDLVEKIKRAFAARKFKSEIFVSAGGNWAWGHRRT